jgi:hypothetical protein
MPLRRRASSAARRILAPAAFLLLLIAVLAPPAAANDEQALAARYAPVVRLVAYDGDCEADQPYVPIDVDLLFGEPTVALRGPWGGDLVAVAPTAQQLAKGLYEYHLDFPGNALSPGCSYLDWQGRLTDGHRPEVYAHVATEADRPGKLALQYWFFYVFNQWNNLHEGDWEMIQLNFDASSPAEALTRHPVAVGYSQHEGAERADWGSDKLEVVDGTHPVVYPADGSHANFYGEALYLGSSASEGVGCDDTRGPSIDVLPVVHTVPSDPAAAREADPWIDFEGRWGELRPAFFNGPTGPNLKSQWTEPIKWSEDWRDRSYVVPTAALLGNNATGFFCTAIGRGSRALVQLVSRPLLVALVIAVLALIVLVAISRATWRPTAPLRIAVRRTTGQILSASSRMYVKHVVLFVAIGLALIPITLVISLLQALVLHGTGALGVQTTGQNTSVVAFLVLAVSTALTLLGLGLVQAVTARTLVELDAGRRVGPLQAYRLVLDRLGSLFAALLVASVVVSLLAASAYGIPIAIWLAGCWALVPPAIELEDVTVLGSLGRSRRLVRGHWLKVSFLIVLGGAVVLLAGPILGVLLILGTDAPFWLVNLVAGVVYAVTMPFLALVTAYAYFDARVRIELEGERDPGVRAAEIAL